MKRSKKLIGIVLSLILAISITATIFIATANTKETDIIITVDKAELSAGERATVSVKVTSNYPIATMSIPVFYDKTLVDVSDVTATLTDYAVKSAITDTESVDPTKIYANTDIDSDKFGFVLATYIGGAGKEVPETTDNVILTFKITAKTGVSGTETIKCVSQSAKTDESIAGMLYFGATTNGKSIDSIPENVDNINLEQAEANVTVSLGGTVLIANKELTGVIDTDRNYIYGIPAGTTAEDLKEYFTASNGSFDVIANDSGYTNGTGATLVVKDTKGNEVAYYTLVIFGDVNGDAVVDAGDYSAVKSHTLGIELSDVYHIAADCVDAVDITFPTVDAADYSAVKSSTMGIDLTINPYEK